MIKNFTVKELTHTDCGDTNYFDSWEHLDNLKFLGEKLQSIRTAVGFAINVNSGYRNQEVNKKVGGASTSYHTKGLAVDLSVSTQERFKKLHDHILQNVAFDQLGIYKTKGKYRWIHLGFCDKNKAPRSQVYYKEV